MRYQEASLGRIFVIRLEHGEIVHKKIEEFAESENIKCAAVIVVGGVDENSTLIVGPESGKSIPVTPMEFILSDAHEVTGTGTIFPNPQGKPSLHLHMACGREGKTATGCIRRGVKTWYILEVIVFEIAGCSASRKKDEVLGFELLSP